MLAFGLEPEICEHAGTYCRWMVPSTAFFCHSDLQSQFMNCIQITMGPFVASTFAIVFHALFLYVLVSKLGLGVAGVALAFLFSSAASLFFLLAYQKYLVPKHHAMHKIISMQNTSDIFRKKELFS